MKTVRTRLGLLKHLYNRLNTFGPRVYDKMTMGIRVLCPEYRPDLDYALHSGRGGHLLGELKRLREESGIAEIFDFEDCRARLGTGLGGGSQSVFSKQAS